jgi:WD40 repeat protein
MRNWKLVIPGLIGNQTTFAPDGSLFAAVDSSNTIRVWDVRTGRQLGKPMRHGATVEHVAFSADGRRLASGGSDGLARIWDIRAGTLVNEPLRHSDAVRYSAFSPDGRWLVTGGNDNSARVWNAATGHPVTPLLRHGTSETLMNAVRPVAFTPDNRRVITVNSGGEVRTWDARSGELVSILAPVGELRWWGVSFLAGDGLLLRRGGAGVFVWDIPPGPVSPEDAELVAEVLAGGRVDETGTVVPLDRAEFQNAFTRGQRVRLTATLISR